MENEIEISQEKGDNNPAVGHPLTKKERRRLAKEKKLKEKTKRERSFGLRKWVYRILILMILGFGIFKIWQWINTPQPGATKEDILSVRNDDWIKGNADAKVTLIEYADFECPACRVFSTDILKQLENEYKDSLRVVFRHFPLPQHDRAVDAAKAAEAAGFQGKFWQMHDLLYEKQDDWLSGDLNNILLGYAESLGLDKDRFEKDFKSDAVLKSIKDDEDDAYLLRINSTPTFYVNGQKVTITSGYDDLKNAVEKVLAESG